MKRTENIENHLDRNLRVNWSVSRARETDGYPVCTLRDHMDKKQAACNGGGYDMVGTVFAEWMCRVFKAELCALKPKDFPMYMNGDKEVRRFYGLSFHNPNYDPGKAVITARDGTKMTIDEAEAKGESLGLDRYQQTFAASRPMPSKVFTEPYMNGSAGLDAVKTVMNAIGVDLECLDYKTGLYRLRAYDKKRHS